MSSFSTLKGPEPCCLIHFQNLEIHPRYSYPLFSSLIIPIEPQPTFQTFFTFTLLPGSSALLQTPRIPSFCTDPMVGALSLTRKLVFLRLRSVRPDGYTRSELLVSVRHTTYVISLKSSLKTFLFSKTISSVPLP